MNTGKQNYTARPTTIRQYRYGVYGLSEWVALIPVGEARLRISFAGGETSGYGRVPAQFVTADRAVSQIIESSEYFKRGRIVRLNP